MHSSENVKKVELVSASVRYQSWRCIVTILTKNNYLAIPTLSAMQPAASFRHSQPSTNIILRTKTRKQTRCLTYSSPARTYQPKRQKWMDWRNCRWMWAWITPCEEFQCNKTLITTSFTTYPWQEEYYRVECYLAAHLHSSRWPSMSWTTW
jgi:hypothetical protein